MEWLEQYLRESGQSLAEGADFVARALGSVTPLNAQNVAVPGELPGPSPELGALGQAALEAPAILGGAPLRPTPRPSPGPTLGSTPPSRVVPAHRASTPWPSFDVTTPDSPGAARVVDPWPFGEPPQRRLPNEFAPPDKPIVVGNPHGNPDGPENIAVTMAEVEELMARLGIRMRKNDAYLAPGNWLGTFSSRRDMQGNKIGLITLKSLYPDDLSRLQTAAHELAHGIDYKLLENAPGYYSPLDQMLRGGPDSQVWRPELIARKNWPAEENQLRQAAALARYGTTDMPNWRKVLEEFRNPETEWDARKKLTGSYNKESKANNISVAEHWAEALALYLVDPRAMKKYFPHAAKLFRDVINPSALGKHLQLYSAAPLVMNPSVLDLIAPDEAFSADPEQDPTELLE